MTGYGHVLVLLVFVFICSSFANVTPKAHRNISKIGQKRIDVQVNKWREAQQAINSLIDESISNEVTKAKKEVKALLEKNIVKHLHEASKRVMMEDTIEGDEEETENGEGDNEKQNDEQQYDEQGGVCQDEFENCATLLSSGVCNTSREAMKKHCAMTCGLCDDEGEELPPAAQSNSDDTWTIIGSNGERFTAGGDQQGIRKASITNAQVQRLLEYVKKHAPHLTLKKVKPGVLKLIRIKVKKEPHRHKLSLKKKNDGEKNKHKDMRHDNYWTIKDNKKKEEAKVKTKAAEKTKGRLLHFDLSHVIEDENNGKDHKEKDVGEFKPAAVDENNGKNHKENDVDEFKPAAVSVHHKKKTKSEEYLKHICHPMCKKTCISSCAPGCCAGEHQHEFPLYHRKSSHCHPFCKKHCISSCPLTCCAETEKTSKTWHHPHVHRITPGCHPMCKKNCVPSCPKACCSPKPAKTKSHCHPLCNTNCLSSCPLSCCSHKDRLKEKCHPLCRKTCLSSCPDECCGKQGKQQKLLLKSSHVKNIDDKEEKDEKSSRSCPALCPDSCAPACHSACCNSKKDELITHKKTVSHVTPSGCTANCVYECLPGCPPACCIKSRSSTPKMISNQQPVMSDTQDSPIIYPLAQPYITPFVAPPPPQPVLPVYQQEMNQPMFSTMDTQSRNTDTVAQRQPDTTSFFAPKHCPSSCLTHCSPECVRSDCCDLD